MKRLFTIILLISLAAFTVPSVSAQTPELVAVYVSPETQETGGGTTVLCIFDDGTYTQSAVQAGQSEIRVRGRWAKDSWPVGPGYVRIYPARESQAAGLTPVVAESGGSAVEDAYYDEGVDTKTEIIGFTEYRGDPAFRFLSAGDKIAVISPSALPGWAQTEETIEGLRSWGYEPVLGKHAVAEVRTLEQCIEDLKWALEDPEIKAIFCIRGGYGATEVMDALDPALIAGAGKPIIGYSDIAVYHGAWTRAGLPSIHASMSGAFEDFPEACAEAERRMMRGELPVYRCEADAYCREGTAEGILIGGNLASFAASLDTAYDSATLDQPYILFLEEVGENMQHIHRFLTMLRHEGILDGAAGIVFGEWTELPADGRGNYGESRGGLFESVSDMISRQFLDGLNIPVAFGFPAGHGDINYPLLLGAKAKLDVSADSFTLSWPDTAGAQSNAGGTHEGNAGRNASETEARMMTYTVRGSDAAKG